MSEPLCARCGKPATGFATINQERYCHGDDDPSPTCYMQGSWDLSRQFSRLDEFQSLLDDLEKVAIRSTRRARGKDDD